MFHLAFVAGHPHELGQAQAGPHVHVGPQQHSPGFGGLAPAHWQVGDAQFLQAQVFVDVSAIVVSPLPGKTGRPAQFLQSADRRSSILAGRPKIDRLRPPTRLLEIVNVVRRWDRG